MALPAPGELISFNDVNNQLRRATAAPLQLGDAQVRALAAKPSGQIAMSDLAGKWAGSRVTVGVGSNVNIGTYYGFKAAPFPGPAGTCEGEYAGTTTLSALWCAADQRVYVAASATPNSNTIKITDDSFNVIGTYTLGAWFDLSGYGGPAGSKFASSAAVANPFGTTAGAKRWFTW